MFGCGGRIGLEYLARLPEIANKWYKYSSHACDLPVPAGTGLHFQFTVCTSSCTYKLLRVRGRSGGSSVQVPFSITCRLMSMAAWQETQGLVSGSGLKLEHLSLVMITCGGSPAKRVRFDSSYPL